MTTPFSLSGRTALVTGAGGRVGAALCQALATAGAGVLLAGRDRNRLEAVGKKLGSRLMGVETADLAREEGVSALFDGIEREHIGIDILVNNAGIASTASFGNIREDDLREVLAVNVVAPLLCAQRAAPAMQDRGHGKILNIGSIYGSVGVDRRVYEGSPGMVQASPVYVASKSALVNLTRDLAVLLAPWGIQVNMLSPGGIASEQPPTFVDRYTQRTPAGRMARPTDLAGTAVYLCSPASDYVTGQNVLVDGGLTAW